MNKSEYQPESSSIDDIYHGSIDLFERATEHLAHTYELELVIDDTKQGVHCARHHFDGLVSEYFIKSHALPVQYTQYRLGYNEHKDSMRHHRVSILPHERETPSLLFSPRSGDIFGDTRGENIRTFYDQRTQQRMGVCALFNSTIIPPSDALLNRYSRHIADTHEYDLQPSTSTRATQERRTMMMEFINSLGVPTDLGDTILESPRYRYYENKQVIKLSEVRDDKTKLHNATRSVDVIGERTDGMSYDISWRYHEGDDDAHIDVTYGGETQTPSVFNTARLTRGVIAAVQSVDAQSWSDTTFTSPNDVSPLEIDAYATQVLQSVGFIK